MPSCLRPFPSIRNREGAFTLIELMVVIAVISLLAVIAIPGVTKVWSQFRGAQAENTIKGLLASARARAIAEKKESGLFFCLAPDGRTQTVYPISLSADVGGSFYMETADRFDVLEGRIWTLPLPMRVVPRSIVAAPSGGQPDAFDAWSDVEMANNVYPPANQTMGSQHHRNYFTIVFNARGEPLAGRVVNIRDASGLTGLLAKAPMRRERANDTISVGGIVNEPWLTGADGGTLQNIALNFPSVDGVIVYDDQRFQEAFGGQALPQQRLLLGEKGQPIYIQRTTGTVIEGPAPGE